MSRKKHVHLVGIGGVGMSSTAYLLLHKGYRVSGSDINPGLLTRRLECLGAKIFTEHKESNVRGAEVVVYSSAIPSDNPEIRAAKREGIPLLHRAEMLARLMEGKKGILVAGSHGKTTTSSMIASILIEAELDPVVSVGGIIRETGSNARWGRGEYFVAESDESDASLLKLSPTFAVVTNIEDDHLPYYGNMEALLKTFEDFIHKIPPQGRGFFCIDDPNLCQMVENIPHSIPRLTYGLKEEAELWGRNIHYQGASTHFQVMYRDDPLFSIALNIPGRHNILNALAAIGVGLEAGVEPEKIKLALHRFLGVNRRFQIKGVYRGITIVDDYAHHPTEVKAVLETLSQFPCRRVIAIFQPHRFTRTQQLHRSFGKVLGLADEVIITPIYPAGERPIEGISAELIAEELRRNGHLRIRLIAQREELIEHLLSILKEGDLVITLGAGDVWKLGERLIDSLKGKRYESLGPGYAIQ